MLVPVSQVTRSLFVPMSQVTVFVPVSQVTKSLFVPMSQVTKSLVEQQLKLLLTISLQNNIDSTGTLWKPMRINDSQEKSK